MGDLLANPLHLTLLIIVIVLLFGASKLGDVGGALGKSIREFKKEAGTGDPPHKVTSVPPAPTAGYVPPPASIPSYSQPSTLETPQPVGYVPGTEPTRPISYTPGDYRPSSAGTPPPAAPAAAPPDFPGR